MVKKVKIPKWLREQFRKFGCGHPGDWHTRPREIDQEYFDLVQSDLPIVWVLGDQAVHVAHLCRALEPILDFHHVNVKRLLMNSQSKVLEAHGEVDESRELLVMHRSTTHRLIRKEMAAHTDTAKGFLISRFPRLINQTYDFEACIGRPVVILYIVLPDSVSKVRRVDRFYRTTGERDDGFLELGPCVRQVAKELSDFHDEMILFREKYQNLMIYVDGLHHETTILSHMAERIRNAISVRDGRPTDRDPHRDSWLKFPFRRGNIHGHYAPWVPVEESLDVPLTRRRTTRYSIGPLTSTLESSTSVTSSLPSSGIVIDIPVYLEEKTASYSLVEKVVREREATKLQSSSSQSMAASAIMISKAHSVDSQIELQQHILEEMLAAAATSTSGPNPTSEEPENVPNANVEHDQPPPDPEHRSLLAQMISFNISELLFRRRRSK